MKIFNGSILKGLILIALFFHIHPSLVAQNFQGVITNASGKPIDDCYVLIINMTTNEVLNYGVPDEEGKYHIEIEDSNASIIKIMCQGLSYNSQSTTVSLQNNINLYKNNFMLAVKEQKLDEVVVVSERVAVKIKKDTVVYDVSKFKSIEDRKIIDVLEKMPGIKVDERTGLIQYKGKPIETILLDGDDLFGKGYSIGARNISAGIVDKVEAIEDYHENRLKKGLKKSDKVALNLKFKKNMLDFSGEASVGLGKDSYIGNINIVNLSKRVKGFGVFNVNNISINQTPFQEYTYSSENKEEIENYATDFFRESSVTVGSVFPRSYINNLEFGTYHNLLKISEKLSLKNDVSVFGDNSKSSYFSQNKINIDGELIRTSNETINFSKPFYLTFSNELKFDINNSSILNYQNRFVARDDRFNQRNVQNGTEEYETQIEGSKFYYQQKLNYTNKVSSTALLELNAYNSNDVFEQGLMLLNQETISTNGFVFDKETIKSERLIGGGDISYLKKIDRFDIQFTAKHIYDKENFNIDIENNIFNYLFENNTSIAIGEFSYNDKN